MKLPPETSNLIDKVDFHSSWLLLMDHIQNHLNASGITIAGCHLVVRMQVNSDTTYGMELCLQSLSRPRVVARWSPKCTWVEVASEVKSMTPEEVRHLSSLVDELHALFEQLPKYRTERSKLGTYMVDAATYMIGVQNEAIRMRRVLENARRALGAALKKGLHSSRKDLEDLFDAMCSNDTGNHDRPANELDISTHKRQFDLVRYMRAELAKGGLISEDEYAWLCGGADMAHDPVAGGSPSPRRLEDYDAMRERIKQLESELAVKQ